MNCTVLCSREERDPLKNIIETQKAELPLAVRYDIIFCKGFGIYSVMGWKVSEDCLPHLSVGS